MATRKIIAPYTIQYTNPITLRAGDTVTLGEEEQEEKWKGWIWAESADNKGWIPIQVVEIAEDRATGKVIEYYTAKELGVEAGDEVEPERSLNGWSWCKNLRTGDEGWIPDEVIG